MPKDSSAGADQIKDLLVQVLDRVRSSDPRTHVTNPGYEKSRLLTAQEGNSAKLRNEQVAAGTYYARGPWDRFDARQRAYNADLYGQNTAGRLYTPEEVAAYSVRSDRRHREWKQQQEDERRYKDRMALLDRLLRLHNERR